MGDYIYERFTPDRFQDFVGALMLSEYPGLQVYPVGQKDGGRDGRAIDPTGDSVVIQVKFKRALKQGEDYVKWLTRAFDAEVEKVERLAKAGARKYVLVTNVPGTAAPDSGTMDKVHKYLNDHLPIPAQCLWRTDLDARLSTNYDLKWFYSEILATPDVVRQLFTEAFNEHKERRTAALTGYMMSQYSDDASVKFKQAELQASDLLNLFVDVPGQIDLGERAFLDRPLIDDVQNLFSDISQSFPPDEDPIRRRSVFIPGGKGGGSRITTVPMPAGSLLLHPTFGSRFARTVVEGAPGQGKSTLAQYLCQVHRMLILNKEVDLKRIPGHHRLTPMRLPFKVDLRDLSQWLEGVDHRKKTRPEAHGRPATLETFLAHEVEHRSGGQSFDASDLHATARSMPILLVLDGFDEVATPQQRAAIVDAVDQALARLSTDSLAVQAVVTSRPSALPDSPRFDDDGWQYVRLASITKPLALEYAQRWGKARRLDPQELVEIEAILGQKLESPHLRDLARNPMQLTILLTLIHLRGQSLPDQRTAMYDSYIEVFFNREAEKTSVVRDNRQLLIDLHGHLAWKMHSDAEASGRDGRILTEDLKATIGSFLASREYDKATVDALFEGVVQRIVALVSRSEGTFEFEVQPLREYFAAHHLYHTAPYSPPGKPVVGTKPEILAALVENPYWQNVLRFFAGFYSVGELPGLASDLIALLEEPTFSPIYHRRMATNLLSDWVFHQSPVWTRKLVESAVDDLTLRIASESDPYRTSELTVDLHADCGGELTARLALVAIPRAKSLQHAARLANLARGMLPKSETEDQWWKWVEGNAMSRSRLLRVSELLGLTKTFTTAHVERLEGVWTDTQDLRAELCLHGTELCMKSEDDAKAAARRLLNGESLSGVNGSAWISIGWRLHPSPTASLLSEGRSAFMFEWSDPADDQLYADPALVRLAEAVKEHQRSHGPEFSRSLAPWQEMIDIIEREFGAVFLASYLACASAGIVASAERGKNCRDLFDATRPLTGRARYARMQGGNHQWWSRQLEAAESGYDRRTWALFMLCWGSSDVQAACGDSLDTILGELHEHEFAGMVDWIVAIRGHVRSPRRTNKPQFSLVTVESLRRAFVAASLDSGALERDVFLRSEARASFVYPDYARAAIIGWILDRFPNRPKRREWEDLLNQIRRLSPDLHLARIPGWDNPGRSPRAGATLTEELSRQIIREALAMPQVAVQGANLRLTPASTKLVPLGTMANRDGWSVG